MLITHHALLVYTGNVQSIVLRAIPDTEVRDTYHERFGIDEARTLVSQANLRPSVKEKQLLVIRTSSITHEAQNALLKILEEPPDSSVIVFVVPKDFDILPTLLSRFMIGNELLDVDNQQNTNRSERPFEEFLVQDYKDRLQSIELAIKNKDITWQREIKSGLIQYLEVLERPSKESTLYTQLLFVASKLLTRGASNKMLLEHVALSIKARSQTN